MNSILYRWIRMDMDNTNLIHVNLYCGDGTVETALLSANVDMFVTERDGHGVIRRDV